MSGRCCSGPLQCPANWPSDVELTKLKATFYDDIFLWPGTAPQRRLPAPQFQCPYGREPESCSVCGSALKYGGRRRFRRRSLVSSTRSHGTTLVQSPASRANYVFGAYYSR